MKKFSHYQQFTKIFGLATFLVTIAAPAWAGREDAASVRALGLADAVQGQATANGAIYHNPAGLARTLTYSVESGYYTLPDVDGTQFNFSVADTKTNRNMGVGVGYTYSISSLDADRTREAHGGRLSFATEALPERMWVGAGLRYLNVKRDVFDDNQTIFRQTLSEMTVDLGIQLQLIDDFLIGIVGRNLVNVASNDAPVEYGMGLAYTWEGLTLSVDGRLDTTSDINGNKFIWATAMEYLIGYQFAFRTGFKDDTVVGQKYVSFGMGWLDRAYALEAGFQQSTSTNEDRIFGIALKMFM